MKTVLLLVLILAAFFIYTLDAQKCSPLTCAAINERNGACTKIGKPGSCKPGAGEPALECIEDKNLKKSYCYVDPSAMEPGDRCIEGVMDCSDPNPNSTSSNMECAGPPKELEIGEDTRCHCKAPGPSPDLQTVIVYRKGDPERMDNKTKCVTKPDYEKYVNITREEDRCSDANILVKIHTGHFFAPLAVLVIYWFLTSGC